MAEEVEVTVTARFTNRDAAKKAVGRMKEFRELVEKEFQSQILNEYDNWIMSQIKGEDYVPRD